MDHEICRRMSNTKGKTKEPVTPEPSPPPPALHQPGLPPPPPTPPPPPPPEKCASAIFVPPAPASHCPRSRHPNHGGCHLRQRRQRHASRSTTPPPCLLYRHPEREPAAWPSEPFPSPPAARPAAPWPRRGRRHPAARPRAAGAPAV